MKITKEQICYVNKLISEQLDNISLLNPDLFFDGSEDGGLEDGVSGYEARAIKFWAKNKNDFWAGKYLHGSEKKNYEDIFFKSTDFLKSIDSLSHAFLFFVNPGFDIPQHKDDDDFSLRVVISLNEPGNDYGLWVENIGNIYLKKNDFFELDAQKLEHRGWNKTNNVWVLLVLCFDKNEP